MYRTPLYNGHYFEVPMVSRWKGFTVYFILINVMCFGFILFVNTRHDHELISVKQAKVNDGNVA